MTPIRRYTSCREFVEEVTAYHEGVLARADRDRFEEHHLICPPCREYSRQLRLTADLLAGLRRDGGPVPPPAEPSPASPAPRPGSGYRRAVKFLGPGAVAPISGAAWPVPSDGAPGDWVGSDDEAAPSATGVHACRPEDMPYWLDDELWTVELDGAVAEDDRKVVARRARLVGRVAGWNDGTRAAFVDSCLEAIRGAVVHLLEPRGDSEVRPLRDVPVEQAVVHAGRLLGSAGLTADERAICGYFGDAVDYRDLAPSVAFIGALAAELAHGDGGAQRERRRQAEWLTDRLDLG